MAYVRKWLVGGYITSVDELMAELDLPPDDMRWIFWWTKPMHPRVAASLQFSMVCSLVKRRKLRWGVLNPDYKPPKGGPKPWGAKSKRPPFLLLGRSE